MPPKKKRKRSYGQIQADRLRSLKKAIKLASKDAKTPELRLVTNELLGAGLAYSSILEGKDDEDEPIILWASSPMVELLHVISELANATNTPVDQVIQHAILNVSPNAQRDHRWN